MRILTIYFLSKFQVSNILSIMFNQHIIHEYSVTHFTTEGLYPLTSYFPFSPARTPTPGNHILCSVSMSMTFIESKSHHFTFLLWLMYYWEMCYTSRSIWGFFWISFCYWFLLQFHWILTADVVWFLCFKIWKVDFYGPGCDLSWWIFHVSLRSICDLVLLNEVTHRCQL
jgi:hypothetical protein